MKTLNLDIFVNNIKLIKEKLGKAFAMYTPEQRKDGGFVCKVFKLLNELLIIKASVDNNILQIDKSIIEITALRTQLISVNPLYREIFELGSIYEYNFPDNFVKAISDIVFEFDYKDLDFDFVGNLYQFYMNPDDKKKYGQFYTPEPIIDEILDDLGIVNENGEILRAKFLDTACGTGSFLVRIVNRLVKLAMHKDIDSKSIANIISEGIHGLDIKEFAVYIAKSNILIQLLPIICKDQNVSVNLQLYVTNTLLNLTEKIETPESDNILHMKQRKGKFSDGFDYVIGNPPYFKATSLSKSQNEFFAEVLEGQQNMYGLFLYLNIKLLKDNGKLGIIIPESIKSGLYFKALRNYIFSCCTITHLVTFDCRKTNFTAALQGVLIICLEKIKACDTHMKFVDIKNVTNKNFLSYKKFNNKIVVPYNSVIRSVRDYPILLICKKSEDYDLFNKAYDGSNFLDDEVIGFKVHTGKLVWNQVKDYLSNSESVESKKLIWANNVAQYKYTLSGDKNGENKYACHKNRLENRTCTGECILVRRTSVKEQQSRINACFYSDEGFYFVENHVNYLKKVNACSKISYNYILALLNSEFMNFIVSQITGNNQISVTELNLLPIKYPEGMDDINFIVEKLSMGTEDSKELRNQIEIIIQRLYWS